MEDEFLTENNAYLDENMEENIEVDTNMALLFDTEYLENSELDQIQGENISNPLGLPETSNADNVEKTPKKVSTGPEKKRLVRLPLARVKNIMKMDPECQFVSQETVFLVTKATELFLEYLGQQAAIHTVMAKKKTMSKRDVEGAIDSIPHLCFLDGALE